MNAIADPEPFAFDTYKALGRANWQDIRRTFAQLDALALASPGRFRFAMVRLTGAADLGRRVFWSSQTEAAWRLYFREVFERAVAGGDPEAVAAQVLITFAKWAKDAPKNRRKEARRRAKKERMVQALAKAEVVFGTLAADLALSSAEGRCEPPTKERAGA